MTITNTEALTRVIEHREIFHDEMLALMRRIMGGEMSQPMMAALLIGLRVKKETIGEITAAAQVMREFSTKVEVTDRAHLVDIVGTGGDGSHTFNISTCTHVRRRGLRRAGQQARQPQRFQQVGQRRRARGAGRAAVADAGRNRALHRRHRHRLHVRAQPPPGDEERRRRCARSSACARSSTSSVR